MFSAETLKTFNPLHLQQIKYTNDLAGILFDVDEVGLTTLSNTVKNEVEFITLPR